MSPTTRKKLPHFVSWSTDPPDSLAFSAAPGCARLMSLDIRHPQFEGTFFLTVERAEQLLDQLSAIVTRAHCEAAEDFERWACEDVADALANMTVEIADPPTT